MSLPTFRLELFLLDNRNLHVSRRHAVFFSLNSFSCWDRFGVMFAANALVRYYFPQIQRADADEQSIIFALAATHKVSVQGSMIP